MADLEQAPDALLAERATDGDTAAFAVLARRHHRMLRAYAWRLTGSAADADDALQNGLLLAWQRLPRLHEPAAVRSWMATIVGRCATEIVRRRRPTVDLDAASEVASREPAPERAAQSADAMRALAVALQGLPDGQRLAWVLREIGGESYGEIAGQLGTTPTAVRGLLARAREKLQREMEAWR